MIATLGAYVTGWLASKWLSWLGSVVGWVWWIVKTTLKSICTPAGMVAACVVATIFFCVGAWSMWGFVGYRVKTVEAQMTALWQDMSNKDREDARKAAEARAAREAAEAAERQRQINETNTAKLNPLAPLVSPDRPAAVAVSPDPAGVRDGKTKIRRRECQQGLFGCL